MSKAKLEAASEMQHQPPFGGQSGVASGLGGPIDGRDDDDDLQPEIVASDMDPKLKRLVSDLFVESLIKRGGDSVERVRWF